MQGRIKFVYEDVPGHATNAKIVGADEHVIEIVGCFQEFLEEIGFDIQALAEGSSEEEGLNETEN